MTCVAPDVLAWETGEGIEVVPSLRSVAGVGICDSLTAGLVDVTCLSAKLQLYSG